MNNSEVDNNLTDNILLDDFTEEEVEIESMLEEEFEESDDLEIVLMDDKNEFILSVKKQIKAGTKIWIIGKGQTYQMVNPKLDEERGELSGGMRARNNQGIYFEDLRIKVNELSINDSLHSTINFKDVKFVKGGKLYFPIEETADDEDEQQQLTFNEVNRIPLEEGKENPDHSVHQSEQYRKSRNLFLQALCIWFPVIAILAAFAFIDILFLIPAGILAGIAYIILSASIVNSRQYFIECRKKGIKPTNKAVIIRAFSYLGLFLFSAVLLFGPAILVLLISNGIAKKRYKQKYGTAK